MAFCRICGKELIDGQLVCTGCGVPVAPQTEITEEKIKKADLNVGLFIWSLINLILFSQVAAGVIGLVFTLLAKGEELEKAKRYNKIAKIANIIGTVLGVLVALAVIAYFVLVIFVMGLSDILYY